jgi:hypothetical protein
MRYHLAQVTITRMRGTFTDPLMAGLVARVEEMNALAERSKGFVWRLGGEEIRHDRLRVFDTYFLPFEPDRLFYNLSVWESIEDLQHFVVKTAHAEMLRDRGRWIDQFDRATLALWWIPADHLPTIGESAERLLYLDEKGPSPYAFTFRASFAVSR